MKANSMAGPQWLKRWIEVVELQLKARGIIRPGGSAVTVNNEGTIANMVKLLAQDAHEKGYLDFQEYLESDEDDEVIEAEVIEEGEPETSHPRLFASSRTVLRPPATHHPPHSYGYDCYYDYGYQYFTHVLIMYRRP